MVKSSNCSFRGFRFDFLALHGDSQLSIAPVSGNIKPSFGFHGHQVCTDLHAGKTHMQIMLLIITILILKNCFSNIQLEFSKYNSLPSGYRYLPHTSF